MWDKAPVTQQVARRLQQMIRSGELAAGARLPSQRDLAESLNVSRPSLREALLTLETLGLVRTLPARGTFVTDPAQSGMSTAPWRYAGEYSQKEVFELRLLIEGEICRMVASVTTPELETQLHDLAARFAQLWRQGDLVGHVEADLAFHQHLAQSCPNRMLRSVYENARAMLTETQVQPIPGTAQDRMQASIAEHQEIIAALAAHDPARAEQAMRNHIRNTARAAGLQL